MHHLIIFLKTKIRLIPCTTAQVQLRKVIKSIDNAKSVKYNEPHPPPPKQWKIILIIAYYMFYNIHFWYDYNLFKELILKNNTVELMHMNRELILFTINYSLKKKRTCISLFLWFFFHSINLQFGFLQNYFTYLHALMFTKLIKFHILSSQIRLYQFTASKIYSQNELYMIT